jgi:predicted MFS family arabinose efflux permease
MSGLLIVLAVTMLTALFLHERRHPTPFLPVELLRKKSIRYSAMLVSMFAACMFAMVFFLPVYLQLGHRLSPQSSGLLLLPLTGGQVLSSVLAARVARRMRDPQMIPVIGMGTTSVALLLLGLLPPHLFLVIGLGIFVGMGLGSVMAINQIVVQTVAGRARLGAATSMNSLARSTGGAAGAAFFGALVFSFIPGDRQLLLEHATSVQVDEIVHAFHWGFLAMSLVAAAAAFAASRIPRIKLWDVPAK